MLSALAGVSLAAASATAQTLLDDNFTNAVRVGSTNARTGVDRDGGTSNDYAMAYNDASAAAAQSDTNAPNVTAGIAGNSILIGGTAACSLNSYFAATTLGAGGSISFSLMIRTTAVPTAADISFRIGLFDSNAGGRILANTVFDGGGSFTDDRGYAAFFDTGAGSHEIRKRTASVNQNVFSPNNAAYGMIGTSDTTTNNVAANTTYPVTLNIARSQDGLSVTTTSTFNGITLSLTDTSGLITDFDQLGLFFSSAWGGSQFIDDVVVIHTPGAPTAPPLRLLGIDFNRDDVPGAPSQSLFRVISGSAANQSANASSYTKTFGTSTVTVSQPGATKFEFRGANTDGSRAIPGGDISKAFLVADFIATRAGAIDIAITGLEAGNYRFRSFHLDTFTGTALGFAQGSTTTTPNTIEARIGGTLMDSVQPNALGTPGLNTTFIADNQIPMLDFIFSHNGSPTLSIDLEATQTNGANRYLLLNGFELFALPAP